MIVKSTTKAKLLAFACLILAIVLFPNLSRSQNGSASNPFTQLGQAQSITSEGVYYFNLTGTTFSTYVRTGGWVQVAIDFSGSTGGAMPQGISLTNTTRGILSPAVLLKLGSATKARIHVSTGQLDVQNTNATIISRIVNNQALHKGSSDNGINNWTGTNTLSASFSAGGCNATSNNGLHQRVIHAACNVSGVHWIPIDNMRQIRNNLGEIPSSTYFQLLVQAPAVAVVNGPIFNTQPSNTTQNLCLNSTATSLSVSASGTGTITYQWYKNTTASTAGGTLINGATGTAYTPPTSTAGTTYYYVIATNSQGSTTSSVSGAVTVSSTSVGGTASSNQNICSGVSPTSLTLTGSNGTLQWQVSTNNATFTAITGATASTLTSAQMGSLTSTRYYRAIVTNGACSTTSSDVVTITVTPLPTIQSTQGASICGSGTSTLEAAVNNGTLNWYAAASGGSSIGSGSVFTTPSISTTTTYYVSVTENGCTSSPRTAVTATVNPLPASASNGNGQLTTDVLVVAGGGSGGYRHGGGGGAGGVIFQSGFNVNAGSYSVTVGSGGSGNSVNGNNSTFSTLTAIGGGGGGTNGQVGKNGGSGGGGSNGTFGGSGTTGQGNNGGNQNNGNGCCFGYGAGGGGAAVAAANTTGNQASNGGSGIPISITGSTVYYGGGGGGGTSVNNSMSGGIGGGGAGGRSSSMNGTAGSPNTGGGGGGGGANGSNSGNGGNGGSGVVIIKYAGLPAATGGTITQVGGFTLHTFNSNGTFVFNGSTTSNVPNISNCGPGVVTFNGTVSSGLTLDWYDAPTGGNLLSQGTAAYTTPLLNATEEYYVSVRNTSTGCASSTRTLVTASILGSSTISSNQTVCEGIEPSSVDLSNYTGSIVWSSSVDNINYTAISGQTSSTLPGSVLGTITTPLYVRATLTNGTCVTNSAIHTITPSTLSITSTPSLGDIIWCGKQSSNWSAINNWLIYNGSSMIPATSLPSITDNLIIPANQTCVTNQPSLGSNTINVKNVTIESGATLSLNTGTLNTTGHFVNNGTLDAGTGTVAFIGTNTQHIDGTNPTSFYNLTIDNDHSGAYPSHVAVRLEQDVTVTNTLTLTDGILDVFDHVFTLGTSAAKATISPALGTADSYVAAHHNLGHTGYVKQFVHSSNIGTVYSFPVGDDGKWTPFNLTFNAGSSLAAGSFITSHVNDALITGSNNGSFSNRVVRDWEVEPSAGITSPNYTIEIFHNQDELEFGGTASSGIVPFKWSAGTLYAPSASGVNGAGIVNQGTYTAGADSYTWSGLTTFSNFGGTEVISALPIELISFQANCKEDLSIAVTWTTASEHNTSHYVVEKSRDGINWSVFGQTAAAGNSTELLNYEIIDSEKANETTYYRLTQFDNDGMYEVFGPVSVNCNGTTINNHIMTYPNPSAASFYVSLFTETIEGEGQLTITDASGRPVYSTSVNIQDGNNVFHIGDMDAAPGMYYIQVSNGTTTTDIVKHSLR